MQPEHAVRYSDGAGRFEYQDVITISYVSSAVGQLHPPFVHAIEDDARRRPTIDRENVGEVDIAVVYFNPTMEDRTEVARLRVADSGEFLDRWPRGFFNERDVDLFDE